MIDKLTSIHNGTALNIYVEQFKTYNYILMI